MCVCVCFCVSTAVRVLPVGGVMSPPVAAVAPVTPGSSGVKRNMREKLVKHNFPCLFTVFLLLSPPDAQQAVLAQQQQAIVNQQAIIMVNSLSGSVFVYVFQC